MALQTIFLCFCEDISQNDGVIKPYFMSDRLAVCLRSTSLIVFCHCIFTARCAIVHSAVLLSHVVCLSVTLVDHDHIG